MSFSYKKATQALNYFARQSGGHINKMKALKLLFFADRYHLRKYGRPITNDEYFAMNYGPVPSGGKDLVEGSDFRPDVEKSYAGQFLNPIDRYEYASLNEIDQNVFSKTDLEALEFAWNHFGMHDQFALAEMTHQYPEWKRHEAAIIGGSSSRVKMAFSDYLEDPPVPYDPCFPLTEEDREIRREEIQEMSAIHNLWN
ncbi:MAG: SocA family protein [Lentisphaerae bacterium]|nr:SocA family protein [Lentisphaerota bacterium]